MHYKKLKDVEEKELNGEVVVPNSNGSPVKPGEDADAPERADEPDSTAPEESTAPGSAESQPQAKEPQACEGFQGALGQVRAKVEVCKDESIGKEETGLGYVS